MKIMTLEDFFTLAEMNNGLMVPSRVRELVTVMTNDKGYYVKNVGEATRQWSALARAIAATENEDCLNLFIQLDGLQFIYKWLKDAQKYSNEASDSFVEESITHLLQVLEKLHDENEKMFSSEIWTVVDDLRSHNSLKVQDKARLLFESWEKKRTGEDKKTSGDSASDVGTNGDSTADGMGKCVNIVTKDALEFCLRDMFPSDKAPGDERVSETATCMDDLHPGHVESEPNSDMLLDPLLTDDRPLDHIGLASISNPTVEPPVNPPKGATSATVSCPDVSGKCRELALISDVKDITKIGSSPWKLGLPKEPKLLEEIPFPSRLDAADAVNSLTEPTSLSVSGDKNLCGEGSTWIDQKASDFDGKVAMSNGHSNRRQSSSAFDTKEGGEFNHHVLWSSSGGRKNQENLEDERTALLPNEDDGKINTRHDLSIRDYVLATDYSIFQKDKNREHEPSGKKSTVNLDYGLWDPLEFARQVAIEVEREVVDYREQSCSSEKLPGENVQPSCSLDSVKGYRSHASGGSSKEAANDLDLSGEASSRQEESSASSKDTNAEPADGIQDVEISQVTETSREETNKEKGVCNFDLNVEVCSEDADRTMNQFSVPVSVVSASRPVAAPGFPTAPLRFGGNLGWKGSASTSAFRPVSSRRMPDIRSDLSNVGRSIMSKHRQELLDIDLNVAESGDGRTRDLSADKQVLASLSLPFRESSVEMRSRSEHIALEKKKAAFAQKLGDLEKKKAARRAVSVEKKKRAKASRAAEEAREDEIPATEDRVVEQAVGPQTETTQESPASEDHIPLVQRKRKAVAEPETFVISDTEEGGATTAQAFGSQPPESEQIPTASSLLNFFLEGDSPAGFKLMRGLRSSEEVAFLKGMKPTQKVFEGTNRAISALQMLLSAFEEVATAARKEGDRAKTVREAHQKIQSELARANLIHDEVVTGLRVQTDVTLQQLSVAQSDLGATQRDLEEARVAAEAASTREILLKGRLSSLESQVRDLLGELETQKSRDVANEMAWRDSFLQSAEFKAAVEDKAFSYFRTGFLKCRNQFKEAGLMPEGRGNFPDFGVAIQSLPKEGEEISEEESEEEEEEEGQEEPQDAEVPAGDPLE